MSHIFSRVMQRPESYEKMDDAHKWVIDRHLDILQWDGNCPHRTDSLCPACTLLYKNRFDPSPAVLQMRSREKAARREENSRQIMVARKLAREESDRIKEAKAAKKAEPVKKTTAKATQKKIKPKKPSRRG